MSCDRPKEERVLPGHQWFTEGFTLKIVIAHFGDEQRAGRAFISQGVLALSVSRRFPPYCCGYDFDRPETGAQLLPPKYC